MKRTIPTVLASVAALVASTFGAATAQAAVPAISTTINYTALGDSYPAGYGLVSPSTQAYPALLASSNPSLHLVTEATSGATTSDVITTQIPAARKQQKAKVITVTVGADDLKWAQAASDCVTYGSTSLQCTTDLADLAPTLQQIPSRINAVVTAAKAANPRATVIVTGYPDPFGYSQYVYGTNGAVACPVDLQTRATINAAANALDTAILAGSSGATYVDTVAPFTSHGLCDVAAPWLATTFHPNADGQQAYAAAISPVISTVSAH